MSVDALGGYARRDRVIWWLVNVLMRLASPRYRAMVGGAIRYGLMAAARDGGGAGRIAATKTLHQRSETHTCTSCRGEDGSCYENEPAPWPCPTISALDGEVAS